MFLSSSWYESFRLECSVSSRMTSGDFAVCVRTWRKGATWMICDWRLEMSKGLLLIVMLCCGLTVSGPFFGPIIMKAEYLLGMGWFEELFFCPSKWCLMEIFEISLKLSGSGLYVLPPSSIYIFFPGESILRMLCGVGLFSLVIGSDTLFFFNGETNLILGLCLLEERTNVGLWVSCSFGESYVEGRAVERVINCGLGGEGRAVRWARDCGEGERRESMGIIEYIANMSFSIIE